MIALSFYIVCFRLSSRKEKNGTQRPRDGGGSSARIENHYLAFVHLGRGGGRNTQLFLAMQLLFLPQGRVFKRALAGR